MFLENLPKFPGMIFEKKIAKIGQFCSRPFGKIQVPDDDLRSKKNFCNSIFKDGLYETHYLSKLQLQKFSFGFKIFIRSLNFPIWSRMKTGKF